MVLSYVDLCTVGTGPKVILRVLCHGTKQSCLCNVVRKSKSLPRFRVLPSVGREKLPLVVILVSDSEAFLTGGTTHS